MAISFLTALRYSWMASVFLQNDIVAHGLIIRLPGELWGHPSDLRILAPLPPAHLGILRRSVTENPLIRRMSPSFVMQSVRESVDPKVAPIMVK